MADAENAPGGFLHTSLLSPAPSSHASTPGRAVLPHARAVPLKPGGSKESALVRYVDQGILHVQRRFAKRDAADGQQQQQPAGEVRPGAAGPDDRVEGYAAFAEAARDLESLADVVWISGTPAVQVPYLLSIALLAANFLPALPPSPRATFRLLAKLDAAFASLLLGRNVESGEALAGPAARGGRAVSGTEKVRIKSLVDRTRICVVDVFAGADVVDDEPGGGGEMTETEGEDDPDDFNMASETEEEVSRPNGVSEAQGDWDMHIARVYDRTVVELGDVLGGTPIGIVSDD
ncbi:MAG: hypothetical protein INR71_08875 [Terriglobus roseus]|nr:hypothetical protein [Terriglobus roseus]